MSDSTHGGYILMKLNRNGKEKKKYYLPLTTQKVVSGSMLYSLLIKISDNLYSSLSGMMAYCRSLNGARLAE